MGVELPVLGHLATIQNRVAPPPPDGTKSCAKLPFLSIKHKALAPPSFSPPTPSPCFKKLGQGHLQKWHIKESGNLWTGAEGLTAPSTSPHYTLAPTTPLHPLLTHTLETPLSLLPGRSEHPPAPSSSSEEYTVIREPWHMPLAAATALTTVLGSSLTSPSYIEMKACV